ncbi:MAG: hypothetical protein LQ337_008713 [Flavoplaca oasis]|nr:MAG: hypothetical protein LQ337_008713 [Flavoplaca oasis]
MKMALSPTSPNVRSMMAIRSIDDTEQLHFNPNAPIDYTRQSRNETSTSDLPFRIIQWGRGDVPPSSLSTARLTSPYERLYQYTPAYAPTWAYTTISQDAANPRYIPPFTATAIPSYVRSPSTPTYIKRRAESCFDDLASPSIKIRKDEDEEGDVEPTLSPPLLTGRRGSAPNERHSRRSSQHFESWRKKRKDQKMRLKLDAVRYEAEQEALFSAHRRRHSPATRMPGDGEVAIKQEYTREEEEEEEEEECDE